MDLQKAANIAQIVSSIPGLYCAYAAWATLHAGGVGVLLNSQAVLISLGAFLALLIVGALLRITAAKKLEPSTVPQNSGTSRFHEGGHTTHHSPLPHQAERWMWGGILEAVTNAELTTRETGRIIARLSRGDVGTLAQSSAYALDVKWGSIQKEQCSIPFQVTPDERTQPTLIRLELLTASKGLEFPRPWFDLNIAHDDTIREVPFPVYAAAPGHYEIDVLLLVNSQYVSSVQLATEAHPASNEASAMSGARMPGSRESFKELKRVKLEVEVTQEYVKEIIKEAEHTHEQTQGYEHEQGHNYGISM